MGNPASTLHSVPTDEWIKTSEAERVSRMSRRNLDRWAKKGRIQRRDEKGQWLYLRSELEALHDSPETDPAADLLDVARQFIVSLTQPVTLYNEHIQREMIALRARTESLEQLQVEMLKAREASLNQTFEREASAIVLEAEQKRKDAAVLGGLTLVDKAATAIVAGMNGNKELEALIRSIKPEQVTALLGSGLFEAPQVEMLMKLFGEKKQ